MSLADRWDRFWFSPQPPADLAFCRIGFYALMLVFFGTADFSRWAAFPAGSAFWKPLWLFRVLHLHVLSAPALLGLSLVWKIALVCACLGAFTRTAAAVAFVLGTYLIGLECNFGKIEHSMPVLIFTMAFLAISRCGDALSIDALLRRQRGIPAPPDSGEYRWPIRAVWLLMSLAFFAAGVAKLRAIGLHWGMDQRLSVLLLQLRYHAVALNGAASLRGLGWFRLYMAGKPWAMASMGIGTLVLELGFPLTLIDRRARIIFPILTFGMQIGIVLLMNVWFTYYLATYIFWVPWSRTTRSVWQAAR